MAKTKMSDKKRKELLPLIYKVVKEKYDHCNIDKFNAMCKEKFSKKLDEYILEYYKEYDFFKNNHDILLEMGLVDPIYTWFGTSFYEKDIFKLQFNSGFTSNLGAGSLQHQKAGTCCSFFVINRKSSDNIANIYDNMCRDFVENVYVHAKPLYQLVMSAKYCEDILEVWDTEDVRKILLPEKIYPISTITQEYLEDIRNLLSK